MRKFIFFAFLISFLGCKEEIPEKVKQPEIQSILKVALIGDQMVLGEKMDYAETDAYPIQLQELLGKNYILKTFAVNNATVLRKGNQPIWEDTLFQKAQDFQPDIVIIHLGWNDTKIRNWWKYGDEFITDYGEMIDTFVALKSKPKVMLCRPTRIFDIIDTMNDSTLIVGVLPNIDSLGVRKNLETIDLYQILGQRGDLFKYGVYPNKLACRIMAEMIYDAIISEF
jgi:sialate O-acetylesterase